MDKNKECHGSAGGKTIRRIEIVAWDGKVCAMFEVTYPNEIEAPISRMLDKLSGIAKDIPGNIFFSDNKTKI